MTTRDGLVRRIRDERTVWHTLLDEIGEDRMEEPGPMGDWTFKDLATHLLGWRQRTIDRIEAGPGGETRRYPGRRRWRRTTRSTPGSTSSTATGRSPRFSPT